VIHSLDADKLLWQPLHPEADVRCFFDLLRNHPQGLLMLDYDGTLAPFVDERDRAVPYPGVRQALHTLRYRDSTRLVIISGRAVADLRPLLGIDPLPELWGSHGWERLHADGEYEGPDFSATVRDQLDDEWSWLQSSFDSTQLERKPASVAVHWRGIPDDSRRAMEREVRGRWEASRMAGIFNLHAFDGGLELRVAGTSKADAVRTLLDETPEETPAAYLGDDHTDEDAFAALEGRGLRVLVRPELRPTRADVHCMPPEGLLLFLHTWIECS
jgi:trehalose 6-phosphate phosphatase